MAQPSAACKRALADATALCPNRNRASDGLIGDAVHQQRKSDHNDGNAFDLTHDPANGVDCNFFSKLALLDYRVSYVIWNRQIYNTDMGEQGWRPYSGSNGHTHHMHVSIKATLRDIGSPWPWASLEPWNSGLNPKSYIKCTIFRLDWKDLRGAQAGCCGTHRARLTLMSSSTDEPLR